MEYLIQTYNILLLISHSKLMKNIAALTVLICFNDESTSEHRFMTLGMQTGENCIRLSGFSALHQDSIIA